MERDLNSPFEDWSSNIHAVITFLQPFFDDWRSYASLVSALLGVGVLIMENQVLLRMRMGRWEILGYILCKSLFILFFTLCVEVRQNLIPVVVLVHDLFTHTSKQKKIQRGGRLQSTCELVLLESALYYFYFPLLLRRVVN